MDRAPGRDQLCYRATDLSLVADVDLQRHDRQAKAGKFLGSLLDARRIARGNRYFRAIFAQRLGDRPADAATASRNQRYFSSKHRIEFLLQSQSISNDNYGNFQRSSDIPAGSDGGYAVAGSRCILMAHEKVSLQHSFLCNKIIHSLHTEG